MRIVSSIVNKPYISEMDLLRLRKALLSCRLSANGTFLVDHKAPGFSSKMERLEELLDELFQGSGDNGRKAVLFSEWTRMLDAIEPVLARCGLGFVRLRSKVPQKKRQSLVKSFPRRSRMSLVPLYERRRDRAQPAGRRHRAETSICPGTRPYSSSASRARTGWARNATFRSISSSPRERSRRAFFRRSLPSTICSWRHWMPTPTSTPVDLVSGADELKRRLEVLLGRRPDAPLDESMSREARGKSLALAERRRLAAAGGELLTSAFRFLGELLPASPESAASRVAEQQLRERLEACSAKTAAGEVELRVTLPPEALDGVGGHARANPRAGIVGLPIGRQGRERTLLPSGCGPPATTSKRGSRPAARGLGASSRWRPVTSPEAEHATSTCAVPLTKGHPIQASKAG